MFQLSPIVKEDTKYLTERDKELYARHKKNCRERNFSKWLKSHGYYVTMMIIQPKEIKWTKQLKIYVLKPITPCSNEHELMPNEGEEFFHFLEKIKPEWFDNWYEFFDEMYEFKYFKRKRKRII